MMNLRKHIKKASIFILVLFFVFLPDFVKLSAEEINWIEVAKTENRIQLIDTNSIKYKNINLLSVLTKYNEINPEDQIIVNSNSYLMAVDCENRLFSKLPINGDPNQVKVWNKPTNDKLIKKTIISSCSY